MNRAAIIRFILYIRYTLKHYGEIGVDFMVQKGVSNKISSIPTFKNL